MENMNLFINSFEIDDDIYKLNNDYTFFIIQNSTIVNF